MGRRPGKMRASAVNKAMKKPKLKRRNPALDLDPGVLVECVGSLMVDQALRGASMIERAFVVSRIPGLLKEFRCKHDRLNEDGICRACGADRRGI